MRNRFHATSEEIAHKLEHAYGHYSEAYQRVVKYSTDEEIYDFQLNHGFTEDMLAYCAAFCRMQSLHGRSPVYFYRLERELPGDDAGAFHASEHWYVFRTLDHCWRPFDGNDYQLAKAVSNYWANFIKNGDPNGGALPVWTPYDRTSPAYMALDVQSHMQPQVTNEVDLRVKYYCGE